MGVLTVLAENPNQVVNLLKSALAKERTFIEIGVNKTRKRIQQFEKKYGATLDQIIEEKSEIDHTDLAEWEGEVEVLRRLNNKIQELEQIEICV